jgi:hypothetical protein
MFYADINHTTPMLVFLFFVIFQNQCFDFMICVVKCFGCLKESKAYNTLSDHKNCVDENLGTYFECIDGL